MRPNLVEVYPDAGALPRRPVIIVPGVFGSRLMDERTGEVVWGRLTNLLTSRFKLILNPTLSQATDLLDLPIDSTTMSENRDNLIAYDLFDEVAGRSFYKRIVQTLTEVAGYRFGDIEVPHADEDCFAFYYDWRRDVVENSRRLGEAVERVLATRADSPQQDKVDIIAHSLGGIVARYYINYGGEDALLPAGAAPTGAGARRVDTLVMIGVPNEGTLDTVESHNEGVRVGRRLPPEAIFTMPAAYQTLPHGHDSAFIDQSGAPVDLDLYAPETWERYGWSVFEPERLSDLRKEIEGEFGERDAEERFEARLLLMRSFLASALERGKRLTQALDRPSPTGARVRTFAFGGDCTPTPARAMILQGEDGGHRTVFRVKDLPDRLATERVRRLMEEPGDGSVTRASLLSLHEDPRLGTSLGIDYSLFLCDTHRNLTENITFQDNLLHFLLYRR